MKHLLSPKSLVFSLSEPQKYFAFPQKQRPPARLKRKRDLRLKIEIVPYCDKLVIFQNHNKQEIRLLDSDEIERELNKGNTIELEILIGENKKLRAKVAWRKAELGSEGGSKAETGKHIEDIKIERLNAFPERKVKINKEIESVIHEMEVRSIHYVIFQTVDVYRDEVSWQSVGNWYTK